MFIELPIDQLILSVDREIHARTDRAYLALDRRREFLFIGLSLKNIANAIDRFAHEEAGRTAMYSAASCKTHCRYVGSFKFERCARSELPCHVQAHRARYQRVIICATSSATAWHLGPVEAPTPQKSDMGEKSD